jgi:hypothetical protein
MPFQRIWKKLTNDSCWIPGNAYITRNITGDDTPGTNHRSIPDAHSRANDGSASNPDIRANGDRLRRFKPPASFGGTDRMGRRVNLNGWSEKHIVSDGHPRDIENDTVEVKKDLVAQYDVRSVVAEKRGLNRSIGLQTKKFSKQVLSLLGLILTCGVEQLTKIATTSPVAAEFLVEWIVKLAREHFLFLGSQG